MTSSNAPTNTIPEGRMHDQLIELVIETAKDLGEDELGLTEELTAETELFGRDGVLDSMGLVTLVVSLEQAIEDRFNVHASLADEKALSEARSPFRTVATLADYAASQI